MTDWNYAQWWVVGTVAVGFGILLPDFGVLGFLGGLACGIGALDAASRMGE